MILTTTDDAWIIECDEIKDDLIGANVTVEGIVAGMNRIHADWIGEETRSS